MACSIKINSVVGNGGNIIINGTVAGCSSLTVNVTVQCGGLTFTGTGNQIPGTIFWSANIPTSCACGSPITLTATCSIDPTCTITLNTSVLCCCPTVTTVVRFGQCNNNGNRLVTFETTVVIKEPNCTFSVQRDFGDGSFGALKTYTGISTDVYFESHQYAPNTNYTSTLTVSPGCGSGIEPQSFNLSPCPDCNTKPSLANFLCPVARFTLLVLGAVGLMMFFFLPVCNVAPFPVGAMAGTGLVYLILAGIGLGIIVSLCRQCICAPLVRLPFQLGIIFGFIFLMFCAPFVSSCQPTYPLLNAIAIISFGILVLYVIWYLAFRYSCPLTICHFWDALSDTFTKAIFAITICFLSCNAIVPLSCNPVGFATSLGFLLMLLNLSNQMIVSNQNSGNCQNYP